MFDDVSAQSADLKPIPSRESGGLTGRDPKPAEKTRESKADFSLFELETLFTRWAPEPGGPPPGTGVSDRDGAEPSGTASRSTTSLGSSCVSVQSSLSSWRNSVKVSGPSLEPPGERRRRSYVCQACGKTFSGVSNLKAHERVHTGERPFRCSICGKNFSEAGNLKKHQRVHTGEKPFSCERCGMKFAWICNLRTHRLSTSGCGKHQGPNHASGLCK